jgi:phage tail-like protein
MSRVSPYQGFNFVVILSGVELGGFTEVSGISSSTDIAEYREGRPPKPPARKIPGVHKSGDVTLKRGVVNAGEFSAWIKSSQDQITREVIILLRDEKGAPVRRWTLRRARPLKYTGPTFSAKGADFVMEELVLSSEDIESD